jgi:M6 family metalloprotease-like protein
MPKPSTAYAMDDGVTYDEHFAYIADALALADPVMNFAGVDGLYVVGSDGVAIPQSPTFSGSYGTFVADGQALGPAVTFGTDANTWGRTIVPHETGHMFGLPDLYGYFGDQHRFMGVWDLMGNVFQATDLTAWQRRKLDWLAAPQILCGRRTGTSWATLEPLGRRGGAKALFVRTGTTTGLLVENRRRVGNDRGICRSGALVTTVNSAVDSGFGPIKVVGGDRLGIGCGYGPRSDAPLGVGQAVTIGRTTVRVLGSQGGRLEISLTRR